MTKNDTLLQLQNANIEIESGICHYKYEQKKYSEPVSVASASFYKRAKYSCIVFYDIWNELIKLLNNTYLTEFSGNTATQNIFINAVKDMYKISQRYNLPTDTINNILSMDSKIFSETLMLEFIDNYMCLQWVRHLIYKNLCIHTLLSSINIDEIKKEASGSMGYMDLDMNQRVYTEKENRSDEQEEDGRLHPLYVRKFQQYDIQHGFNVYDIENRVYRLINDPYEYNRKGDERQPNRTLSRDFSTSS